MSEFFAPKRNGGVIPLSDLLDNGSATPPVSHVEEPWEEDTVDEDAEFLGGANDDDLNDISDDEVDIKGTAATAAAAVAAAAAASTGDTGAAADHDEIVKLFENEIKVDSEIFDDEDEDTSTSAYDSASNTYICQWNGCLTRKPDLRSFVNHLNHSHISHIENPTSSSPYYSCNWDSCSHKGVRCYTSKQTLLSHVRIHTNEKPFSCIIPECDFSSSHLFLLSRHIDAVHGYNPLTLHVNNGEDITKREFVKEPKEPLAKAKALNPGLLTQIRKIREKESLYNGSDINDNLPSTLEDEFDPHSTINQLKRKLLWSLEIQEQLESELNHVKKQKHFEILQKEKLFDKLLHKHLDSESASLLSLS